MKNWATVSVVVLFWVNASNASAQNADLQRLKAKLKQLDRMMLFAFLSRSVGSATLGAYMSDLKNHAYGGRE